MEFPEEMPAYTEAELVELSAAARELRGNRAFIAAVNETRREAVVTLLSSRVGSDEAIAAHAEMQAAEKFIARLRDYGNSLAVLRSKARR